MIARALRHPLSTIIAILLGIVLGLTVQAGWLFSVREIAGLFFQLVTAIAIPLVTFTIVVCIPTFIKQFSLGKHLAKIALFVVGIVLILVQLILLVDVISNTTIPFDEQAKQKFYSADDDFDITLSLELSEEKLQTNGELVLLTTIRNIIPKNLFGALYGAQLYSILFIAILLGAVFSRFVTKETRFFLQVSEGLANSFEKIYHIVLILYPFVLIPTVGATVLLLSEITTAFGFLIVRFLISLLVILVVLFVTAIFVIAQFNRIRLLSATTRLIRILSYGFFGGGVIAAYPDVMSTFHKDHDRKTLFGTIFALFIPFNLSVFAIVLIFALISLSIFDVGVTISGVFSYIFSSGLKTLFGSFDQSIAALGTVISASDGKIVPLITTPLLSISVILLPIGRMISLLSAMLIAYVGSSGEKKGLKEQAESASIALNQGTNVELATELQRHSEEGDPSEHPPERQIESSNSTTQEDFFKLTPGMVNKKKQKGIRFSSKKNERILSIPFRISVLVLLLVMLGGYGAISTVVNFEGTRISMYGVSNVIVNSNLGFIETQIQDYFGNSEKVTASFDFLINNGYVDIQDFEELSVIFEESILKNYNTIASVFIGMPNGEFILVGRDEEHGGFRRRLITQAGSRMREVYTFDNNPNANVDRVGEVDYDPRTRPWYQLANEEGTSIWTDVYVFASTEVIGATYAYPLFNDQNEFVGVLGVDIDLRDLSLFLSELSVTSQVQGLIYIYDTKTYEMVAISVDSENAYSYLYYQNENSADFDPIRYTAANNPDEKIRESFEAFISEETTRADARTDFLRNIFSIDVLSNLSQQFSGSMQSIRLDESGNFVRFPVDRDHYYGLNSEIHVSNQLDWAIGIIIPEAPLLEIATRSTILQFIGTIILLIIIGIFGNILANRITRPLEFLAEEMLELRELKIHYREKIVSNVQEVNKIDEVIGKLKQGLESFRRYLPTEVVRELLRTNKAASIGAERKDITLFFSDIQNFTYLSEYTEPEVLLHQLEMYFDVMSKCIMRERGTIDKYIGDSVMAFWGAPWQIKNHAESACRAAIRCCQEIAKLTQVDFQKTRIGIHSAEVLVGNVGSDYRLNYTALGDGVNLASRLESLNKQYGTTILMSEGTMKQVEKTISHRFIDMVTVKGKRETTAVYEVLGEDGGLDLLYPESISDDTRKAFFLHYQEGSFFFQMKQWGKAVHHFAKAYSLIPDDLPTKKLYAKSYRLFQKGESSESDGVTHLDKK